MLQVTLIGNLGGNAEIKAADGREFVAFRVAHNEGYTDANGNKVDRTQWIDCTMSNADSGIVPYLKQGVKVFARGHMSLRVYSSPKLRQMVAGVSVAIQEIELVGGSGDEVPRSLIDPTDGKIYPVSKYYWTEFNTKGMKREDTRILVDKRGMEYTMDFHGFVKPAQAPEPEPEQ